MFKHLPERILIERSILHRAELSGAILQYLPHFLDTLSNTKETASYISVLEADLKKSEKILSQNMSEAIEWVKDKIDKLKTSPFAKHSSVEHCIERVGKALHNSENLSPAIHLEQILSNLIFAVSPVAAFGNDPLFEGWAEIGFTKIDPKERAPKFPKKTNGYKSISTKERWELANHFGHGVDQWQVTSLIKTEKNGQNDIIQLVSLHYGIFENFNFPSCIDFIFSWRGSIGLQKWREKRDSDPAILLGFLKILSQYTLCKSTSAPIFLRPKTVQEAEVLCIQGEIRPYLHRFSSTNPEDHPLSHAQLLNLIDTFLSMVEVQITQQSTRLQLTNIPVQKKDIRVQDKKIAEEWMRNEWLKDYQVAQETIVDRLMRAIIDDKVDLRKEYERSTFVTWARNVDPLPKTERVYRLKTKNVKK